MQAEKNIWLKVLSLILTLALLISCVPNQVYAMASEALADLLEQEEAVLHPDTTTDLELSTARIVAEDASRRGEFYKEYIMNNGLRYATVYPSAIHYEDNGQWKDIDNTLVAAISGGKSVYQNTAGAWNVCFPQSLSGIDMIGITKDGHTVQFGMAGELRSSGDLVVASIGQIGSENAAATLAVSTAQTSIAQIQQIDLTEARASAEHPETILDKLNSRLTYANVYPNTNVVYDLQGNQLKESVILQRYDASLWGYRYTLDTGDLIPVLREDRQIDLCHPETNEVILTMPAPYMLDNNGEISYDVEVMLTRNGSSYLLSYYLPREWLADANRAWPVILDPMVSGNSRYTNVKDVTVAETGTESSTRGVMQCGYSPNSGIMRIYMQYIQLPALTSADVIVDATISLIRPVTSQTVANVNVHKVTQTWTSSTITWANKAAYEEEIVDYVVCQNAGTYTWNITSIVQDWYETGNYGMMFKTPWEVENGGVNNWKQFYSSDFSNSADTLPALTITYQNHNGLEDYWSYSSSSAGRAGTGYVNLFTGNLVWVRNDLGFDGNRMPVSISHIYNSNDSQTNKFGMGYGWRTNYNQTITSDDGVYVWEDGDGTLHYFYPAEDSAGNVISNTYLDEDGLHLTLTTGGSGNQTYQLTDQLGNKSFFDARGRLRKIENNQATKSNNTITYTTDTGNLISTITDGVGRVYQFHYQSNLLNKISYLGNDTEEDTYVSYTYDNGDLIRITNIDNLYTTYAYDGHLLTRVEDIPSKINNQYVVDYYITCFYEEEPADKLIRRVSKVNEYDRTVSLTRAGNSASFTYKSHITIVEDHKGERFSYQFNDWGNVVAIHDSNGRTQYTKYALNDVNGYISDTAEAHQVIEISNIDGMSNNQMANSGFENGTLGQNPQGWSGAGTISENHAYRGNRSIRISAESAGDNVSTEGPGCSVESGETYTLSAYVLLTTETEQEQDSEEKGDVMFSFGDATCYMEKTPNGWTRIELCYTNEDTIAETVYPNIRVFSGTLYIDCVQVEKAAAASPYNAVENGDFRAGSNGWSASDTCGADDSYHETTAANLLLSSGSLTLSGEPNSTKYYTQFVPVSGKIGDALVLSGWARANAVPLTEDREFGMKLIFHNAVIGGPTTTHYVSFDPDIPFEWQFAAMTAVSDIAFAGVTIMIVYSNQENEAYFDGIQLTEGRAGTTYSYNINKKMEAETNSLGQTTEYRYYDNGVDLEKIISSIGSVVHYKEYDTYHNVKKVEEISIDPSGQEQKTTYIYEYDEYGNTVSTTITKGNLTQKCVTEYTSNGNYAYKTTDCNANTTIYDYDLQTGVLDRVQYPEDSTGAAGTIDTRTYFDYDEMFRLVEACAATDQNNTMFVRYSYKNDQIETLTTPSTTYRFEYNNLNLLTKVSVGNQTLAEYIYTNDRNHYLSRIHFGNGDYIAYQYDQRGRIARETYCEGGENPRASYVITYTYDNAGIPVRAKDFTTGIESGYVYDSAGRVTGYAEFTETPKRRYRVITYSYDEDGNITNVDENVKEYGGTSGRRVTSENNYSYEYLYDYKNRIKSVKTNDAQKTYSYDELDRLTNEFVSMINSDDDNTLLEYEYEYKTATVGETDVTTNQVSNKIISADRYSRNLTYEYDGNGNIIRYSFQSYDGSTKTTNYFYDSANQLIRENNQAAGSTWVWTYDDAGNIVSKEEYPYTIADDPGEPRTTNTYGYANSDTQWWDLLRSYNGSPITYDDMGNPLSDDVWTYTWQSQRLSSMENDETKWEYTYDASGMRTSRSNGTDTYTYVYTNGLLSEMVKGENTIYFTYDAAGKPMTMKYNGVTYYYVTNLQGDVIAILDNTGSRIVEYIYDAWGVVVGYIYVITLKCLLDDNPFLYRGYVFDKDTGLYYIQGRYYNPQIGRFIQPADISTSNDPNAYRYTNNLTGGSATSHSFAGTAGNTSANLSALVKIPDFSTNPSGVHWKDDWFVTDWPKLLDPTKNGIDLIKWELSIYKGSLYFDDTEQSSLYVAAGNLSAISKLKFSFSNPMNAEISLGFKAEASLFEFGFDGRVVDFKISLLSVGAVCLWENGTFERGINYGWYGWSITIDYNELYKICIGG